MDADWRIYSKRADFNAIANRFNIDPVVARVIRNRDVESEEEIERFLYGTLDDCHDGNLMKEFGKLNWASFVLGIVIVGLEGGWLYAYKAGWQVNTGFIVQSAFVSVLLLFVGYFLYHEALSWNKLLGTAICLLGLVFINLN